LSSGYDAVHFGGDLGCGEDENTLNGWPNLVIVDWSLNVGKWSRMLICRISIAEAQSIVLSTSKPTGKPAGAVRSHLITNNTHTCLGEEAVSRAWVASYALLNLVY
jgi:hypothetical protein